MYTIDEIELAADLYCKDCCHSCDECCLKDFINYELGNLLIEVKRYSTLLDLGKEK